MLVKIVTFFLIGMGVLAMFGKLRVPGSDALKRMRLSRPKKCKSCGGFIVGRGPCSSGKQG